MAFRTDLRGPNNPSTQSKRTQERPSFDEALATIKQAAKGSGPDAVRARKMLATLATKKKENAK